MKHVLEYKESCAVSKISNLAIISSKLWKHYKPNVFSAFPAFPAFSY